MAKIHAQVIGGTIKELDCQTITEVKNLMDAANYTATVNGEPESDDYELSDFEFVTLAPAVKGA